MIASISELWPTEGWEEEYFRLSGELRPALEAIDGFVSSERCQSTNEKGKYLSVSFWRDEQALSEWRNLEEHRLIMLKGREGVMRDYRIRVSRLLYDYGMSERSEAPSDSKAYFPE